MGHDKTISYADLTAGSSVEGDGDAIFEAKVQKARLDLTSGKMAV